MATRNAISAVQKMTAALVLALGPMALRHMAIRPMATRLVPFGITMPTWLDATQLPN